MLSYAVITPARNEAENLHRLARCLAAQSHAPQAWVIVDNGSTDETLHVARVLGEDEPWIHVRAVPGEMQATRGGPVARAFQSGLAELPMSADVVIKVDADVSFERDYLGRLVAEFEADPSLGIASGMCYEHKDGEWQPQHVTRGHVRGATRAYRWACLQDVLPLEDRIGWDGVDEIKARVNGWTTRSIPRLHFLHHRSLAERDRAREAWKAQGEMAYYMGYRPTYLFLRSLFRGWRHPPALAMISGYLAAAVRREPRLADEGAISYLRREQSLRRLLRRVQEATGRTASDVERP